jgi:outer membrane receptor protein involved in Fe transport
MRCIHGLGICLAGAFGTAWAQSASDQPLEEVVVHASLRGESLSQVPASVTVLDSHTLQMAGVQHFEDVLGLVPNLNWAAGTSRPRYFQLRGIGELDQYQGAPNSSIGFLIDDIDFSGVGMPATLYDAQQVEVLRGPQGTAYGANALAGLISIRTNDATPKWDMQSEVLGADYGTFGAGAVLGGPLGGDADAFRLVAHTYKSNGFRRNAFLDRDATNGYDETTLRGKVHWSAADDLQLDFTAMYVDLNNGYDAWSIDNSRVTQSDDPGKDSQLSKALAARIEYTGLTNVVVHDTAAIADSVLVNSFDGDWGNDAFWGIYAPYRYFLHNERNRRTVSNDLRFSSAPAAASDARTAWVGGLYVLHARETNDELDFSNQVPYNTLSSLYHSTSYAAYGEFDVALSRRTRLSLGARVEHRDADYTDTNAVAFSPADSMLGGQLSLQFAARERQNLYVTLSRGYKAGGFNIDAAVPESRRQFKPEYLWNLETGINSRSADGRLLLQADVFYMRRSNQQVETSIQPDPTNPLTFVFFTDNAAHGENYGLEAAVRWQAATSVQLGGTLGLLQTRYLGYQVGGAVLDGRQQAHAPPYQLSLFAEYRHPTGLTLRVDTQSVDAFYYDTSNDQKSNPYTLVNVKLGYQQQHWSAFAWSRNLFNRYYAMRGFYFGDEPPDFPNKRYLQAGDPRQLGVTVSYTFR